MHGSDEVTCEQCAAACRIVYKHIADQPGEIASWMERHPCTHTKPLTKLQQFAARLREEFPNDAKVQWVTIGVDPGKPGADHTVVATKCARCGVMFVSKPDGFVDEALENEIAAHRERCFVVGDAVRWEFRRFGKWAEGRFVRFRDNRQLVTLMVDSCATGWDDIDGRVPTPEKEHEFGLYEMSPEPPTLRRIPRPQQGEAGRAMASMKAFAEHLRQDFPAIEMSWIKVEPAQSPDPLEFVYDDVSLRSLLLQEEILRADSSIRHAWFVIQGGFTPAQRAAVSAHWSAQLRAKLAASATAERNRVRVELDDLDGEPW